MVRTIAKSINWRARPDCANPSMRQDIGFEPMTSSK